MKSWLKKQFGTFPTEGLILKTFMYAFTAHLVALGAINIWQGVTDHHGYFIAGMWQIWAAMFYWMFMGMTKMNDETRKLYRRWIKLEEEMNEEYRKVILEQHHEIKQLRANQQKS